MTSKCETKKGVKKNCYTKKVAIKVAKKLTKLNGVDMGWYRCRFGNHYHVGNGRSNGRGKYQYED